MQYPEAVSPTPPDARSHLIRAVLDARGIYEYDGLDGYVGLDDLIADLLHVMDSQGTHTTAAGREDAARDIQTTIRLYEAERDTARDPALRAGLTRHISHLNEAARIARRGPVPAALTYATTPDAEHPQLSGRRDI